MCDIIVGDYVKIIGKGLRGKVTDVVVGNDIEDHGIVEIEIVKVSHGTTTYLGVGSVEHYVHHNWEDHLKIDNYCALCNFSIYPPERHTCDYCEELLRSREECNESDD